MVAPSPRAGLSSPLTPHLLELRLFFILTSYDDTTENIDMRRQRGTSDRPAAGERTVNAYVDLAHASAPADSH